MATLPKPAKSCHKKLLVLDSVKKCVTNFQLKPAKKSEFLLKKLFLRCSKQTSKASYVSIFGLALTVNGPDIRPTTFCVTEPPGKKIIVAG